jgi:hypothetical protein
MSVLPEVSTIFSESELPASVPISSTIAPPEARPELDTSSAPQGSNGATPPKPTYPSPAPVPTREGPRGIRFDFNLGCRVTLPKGTWHVRLSDLATENILFEADSKGLIHQQY